MYQQYRLVENRYFIIETSSRLDSDNSDILDGKYDNSEVELSREQRLKMIFSDWKEGDILVIAPQLLRYPKLSEDRQTLVEMTREEICATGDLSVLQMGEKYEDGKIVEIENPSTQYLKYNWNKKTFTWELVTSKEELMLRRVDLIMEYNDLKSKITTLEELREFESTETIELLKTKMNKIKEEADMLLEKIKKLK